MSALRPTITHSLRHCTYLFINMFPTVCLFLPGQPTWGAYICTHYVYYRLFTSNFILSLDHSLLRYPSVLWGSLYPLHSAMARLQHCEPTFGLLRIVSFCFPIYFVSCTHNTPTSSFPSCHSSIFSTYRYHFYPN